MRTELGMIKVKASDNRTREMSVKVREDGLLLMLDSPIFVGADLTEAGVPMPTPNLPVEEYDSDTLALALRIDHPRVTLIDDKYAVKVKAMLAGEPEDTRERQNAFLKERGYRWEKQSFYCSGDVGDFVEYWALLDSAGNEVVGKTDGGGWIKEIGSVKRILTELGYYGQEAVDAAAEAKAKSVERKRMREAVDAYFANDANRTGETFENAQAEFTTRPIQIEKHHPRRQFRIEKDCIWYESHNRSDGDDWSLNNCDYGIARQYKFDTEIAECLRSLAS